MKTKTLNKLTLNQETIRNLTAIQTDPGFAPTHKCPAPSVGVPVCTPIGGIN